MSRWESTVIGLEFSHKKVKHESLDSKDYKIKQTEIALKHPDTGAIVKLTDDGFIDVFAGPQLGVRVDPNTSSINLFGDSVNVIANQFNVRTKPYGFNWNGRVFNPALYSGDDQGVMTQAKQKVRYSEGMVEILKDLGLPAETIDKEDN
jgi:hypothetical protein